METSKHTHTQIELELLFVIVRLGVRWFIGRLTWVWTLNRLFCVHQHWTLYLHLQGFMQMILCTSMMNIPVLSRFGLFFPALSFHIFAFITSHFLFYLRFLRYNYAGWRRKMHKHIHLYAQLIQLHFALSFSLSLPRNHCKRTSLRPFNDLHVLRLKFKIHYMKPTAAASATVTVMTTTKKL